MKRYKCWPTLTGILRPGGHVVGLLAWKVIVTVVAFKSFNMSFSANSFFVSNDEPDLEHNHDNHSSFDDISSEQQTMRHMNSLVVLSYGHVFNHYKHAIRNI